MNLIDTGETAHFIVRYDQAIGAHAATRAQAVLATCETDLAKTAFYLPYSMGGGGDPFLNDAAGDHRIVIRVVDLYDNRGGANNSHSGAVHLFHTINIGAINQAGNEISDDFARFLFIAELAEVLMLSYGWNPVGSSGEALSRVLAEQLYPAQAYSEGGAPWVNAWFSNPSRVYTHLVQDEPTDSNDVSFGIGILYINYLRSQLGYSLRSICTSAGQTLLDRYRSLIGRPQGQDDGIAPFKTLLEKHFPDGKKLVTNNPFPLYDTSGRTVSLTANVAAHWGSGLNGVASTIPVSWIDAQEKKVHLSPIVTCPSKDYTYSFQKTPRRLELVATAVGFGLPRFKWYVNGQALTWASDSVIIPAKVEIDDPAHPDKPKEKTDNFSFYYTHADEFSFRGLSNRLVIDNSSYAGRYMLDIRVTVEDQYGPRGSTHASTSALMDTFSVIYEDAYYADRERCAQKMYKAVADHNRGLAKAIKVVDTLPDPPEAATVRALLNALAAIREELVLNGAEGQAVHNAINLFAGQLGVPAKTITGALGLQQQEPQTLK